MLLIDDIEDRTNDRGNNCVGDEPSRQTADCRGCSGSGQCSRSTTGSVRIWYDTTRSVSLEQLSELADWRKHFARIADAIQCDDEQARVVLPTCLTGWALDEFTSMPAHFREEVDGFERKTLGRMLAELDIG